MSQTALGKGMAEYGFPFHQTTISRIEVGHRPVRIGEAAALGRLLKVSVEELVREPAEFAFVRQFNYRLDSVSEPFRRISSDTATALEAQRWLARELDTAVNSPDVVKPGPWATEPLFRAAEEWLGYSPEEAVAAGRKHDERWIEHGRPGAEPEEDLDEDQGLG
jgi:hypothetical protein